MEKCRGRCFISDIDGNVIMDKYFEDIDFIGWVTVKNKDKEEIKALVEIDNSVRAYMEPNEIEFNGDVTDMCSVVEGTFDNNGVYEELRFDNAKITGYGSELVIEDDETFTIPITYVKLHNGVELTVPSTNVHRKKLLN